MTFQIYSQRDPQWDKHPLGWGPALGTIGAFGCFVDVLAMIATDSGHPLTPPAMDELLTARRIFVREASGTYDLLPDNALSLAFPGEYAEATAWGYRGDLIAAAVNAPHAYAVGWISTDRVPTHFLIFASSDGSLVVDPWTGTYVRLSAYGGPGAVRKVDIVTRLFPPAPAPAPRPVGPPPEPVPVPTPPAIELYSFRIPPAPGMPAGELWIPPPAAATTLADAMAQADDWSSSHGAAAIAVLEGDVVTGEVVYDLPAGVVPRT